MPRNSPGPSVKDKKMYESLRDEGASKEKAARISNAAAASSRSKVGRKGGHAKDYDDHDEGPAHAAGPRDRHQRTIDDEQVPAHLRPARPLTPPASRQCLATPSAPNDGTRTARTT